MKLTSITINNMFSYHGISTLRFENISCIIGTNGFGKTSILNSIKLCLGQSNIDINSILNNNANEKKCWVNIDFDEFNIKRTWTFEPKLEEHLSIVFKENEEKLEDSEAEHFIQNKIPEFLIDFLFYDGEIGNNLLLLSHTKLKSIFDYVFDLDLIVNVQKDSQEVAKRLLEKNSDDITKELLILENERLDILDTIANQKEELQTTEKELKTLKMNLQKLNTQIRNRNKKAQHLHEQKDKIEVVLNEKSKRFKEFIYWQMPLLFNTQLLHKMQQRSTSALKIEDESLFTNKFKKFIQELDSPLEESKIFELFKATMINSSSKIELNISQKEFKKLIEELKDLKLEIHQIDIKIKELEDSSMEQEIMRSLVESKEDQEKQIHEYETKIEEIKDTIEQNILKSKEINRTLTQAFKSNQSKYAFIKGYEELQIISRTSGRVYKTKLHKKLSLFNEKLKQNSAKFLEQYEHIQDIYIDISHKIIISDGKQKLNTELLSAGQKQVLNFLIVKTILDFKEFASFVVIDTPFGRLSNKNKALLLNTCYLSFDNLILLLTDSEFEFVNTQNINYKTYKIQRNSLGSSIEEIA